MRGYDWDNEVGHWVANNHERGNHTARANFILCQLSERFWIIAAREEIREWDHKCNKCKRRRSKPACQITAPLSKMRLRFSFRPFAQRTVDFAGPLYTVQGRGKPRRKRWLCLFTCLKTRAVHLEMLFNPLRWPIYVFNSVVNTKLPAFTTVSLNRVSEARKCSACYN